VDVQGKKGIKMDEITIRAKLRNGVIRVRVVITNPSITYNMAERKTGNRENADFITHFTATINGETVADFSTSQFLRENPIFKFRLKGIGAKKDTIQAIATDNHGKIYRGQTQIK